jgi:hypothetical protein
MPVKAVWKVVKQLYEKPFHQMLLSAWGLGTNPLDRKEEGHYKVG